MSDITIITVDEKIGEPINMFFIKNGDEENAIKGKGILVFVDLDGVRSYFIKEIQDNDEFVHMFQKNKVISMKLTNSYNEMEHYYKYVDTYSFIGDSANVGTSYTRASVEENLLKRFMKYAKLENINITVEEFKFMVKSIFRNDMIRFATIFGEISTLMDKLDRLMSDKDTKPHIKELIRNSKRFMKSLPSPNSSLNILTVLKVITNKLENTEEFTNIKELLNDDSILTMDKLTNLSTFCKLFSFPDE